MDAASYAALALVFDCGLPSALEDAMREIERARLRLADEEARRVRLIEAMVQVRNRVDAIVADSGGDYDFWNARAVDESLDIIADRLAEYLPADETGNEDPMDQGE